MATHIDLGAQKNMRCLICPRGDGTLGVHNDATGALLGVLITDPRQRPAIPTTELEFEEPSLGFSTLWAATAAFSILCLLACAGMLAFHLGRSFERAYGAGIGSSHFTR